MSEEEIIKECKRIIFEYGSIRKDTKGEKEDLQALEGLLDLYNKEKECNEILYNQLGSKIDAYIDSNYICKDKIRELEKENREKFEKTSNAVFYIRTNAYKDLLEEK